MLLEIPIWAQPDCSAPSTGLIPINDLKKKTFNGWTGGLYPGGSNFLPEAHKVAGMKITAEKVCPRDMEGKPDLLSGKIVWLSIGMSNTTMESQQFLKLAGEYINKKPELVFVDGAVGGMPASVISTGNNPRYYNYWNTVDTRLANAGVTSGQVQIIWYKEANIANSIPIMIYFDSLVVQTKRVMNIIKQRFPNASICYMASRISARYAATALNPEPYAYYTGWAIKKVIEDQINGDTLLSYSGPGARSPWLSWGVYLWSDGATPQAADKNIFWSCPSDFQNDGIHPSVPDGAKKVAEILMNFYQNDTLSCKWFFKDPPSFCH